MGAEDAAEHDALVIRQAPLLSLCTKISSFLKTLVTTDRKERGKKGSAESGMADTFVKQKLEFIVKRCKIPDIGESDGEKVEKGKGVITVEGLGVGAYVVWAGGGQLTKTEILSISTALSPVATGSVRKVMDVKKLKV